MACCDREGCGAEATKYIGAGLTKQALCLPHYLEHRKSPPPIEDTARLRAEQEREALRRAVVVVEAPVVPPLLPRKARPVASVRVVAPVEPKPARAPKPPKPVVVRPDLRGRLLEWAHANNGGLRADAEAHLGCCRSTLYRIVRLIPELEPLVHGCGRIWLKGTKPPPLRERMLDLSDWRDNPRRQGTVRQIWEMVHMEPGVTSDRLASVLGINIRTVSRVVSAFRRCGEFAPNNARREGFDCGVYPAGMKRQKLRQDELVLLRAADREVLRSSQMESRHRVCLHSLRVQGLMVTAGYGQSRITEAGLERVREIRRRIEAGEVEA